RGYVVIVFFEGAGEAVVTFGVGDEVIIVGLGGMHGGFEGAFAGVADGAGGQSGVDVSVVRRVEMHVVVMQRAGVGSGEKFTVNYAGVGVERDLLLQAVVVNAGDKRALPRDRGFFLDDRGHDYICVELSVSVRRRLRGVWDHADFGGDLAKLLDHGGGHLLHRHHAAELIGVGKEITFERLRIGIHWRDQRV